MSVLWCDEGETPTHTRLRNNDSLDVKARRLLAGLHDWVGGIIMDSLAEDTIVSFRCLVEVITPTFQSVTRTALQALQEGRPEYALTVLGWERERLDNIFSSAWDQWEARQ